MNYLYEVICKTNPTQILHIEANSSWKAAITAARQLFTSPDLMGGLTWVDGNVWGFAFLPKDSSEPKIRFTVSLLDSPFKLEADE